MRLALTALAAIAFALPAQAATVTLLNVSYDPTRELYKDINAAFAKQWKAKTGDDVVINQSHGGSGKQARSVIDGLEADVVTLALAYDIDEIADKASCCPPAGRRGCRRIRAVHVDDRAAGHGRATPRASRTGAIWSSQECRSSRRRRKPAAGAGISSPLGLSRKNCERVGGTRRNDDVRGAWHRRRSGRVGRMRRRWQPRSWAQASSKSSRRQCRSSPNRRSRVIDKVVDKKGTRKVAEAYLKFLYSPEAQAIIARDGYRPRDARALTAGHFPALSLFTIDKNFGGWSSATGLFRRRRHLRRDIREREAVRRMGSISTSSCWRTPA